MICTTADYLNIIGCFLILFSDKKYSDQIYIYNKKHDIQHTTTSNYSHLNILISYKTHTNIFINDLIYLLKVNNISYNTLDELYTNLIDVLKSNKQVIFVDEQISGDSCDSVDFYSSDSYKSTDRIDILVQNCTLYFNYAIFKTKSKYYYYRCLSFIIKILSYFSIALIIYIFAFYIISRVL